MVPRAPLHLQFLSVGKLKVEDGFLNRCYAKTLSYGFGWFFHIKIVISSCVCLEVS